MGQRISLMNRRSLLFSSALSCLGFLGFLSKPARAFGDEGVFRVRFLERPGESRNSLLSSVAERWAWEVVQRTSAPARLSASFVKADSKSLLSEPFIVWTGFEKVSPLTASEIRGLRTYFKLGGVLLVNDESGALQSAFTLSIKKELKRVLPSAYPTPLPKEHVLFKTYYLLGSASGRTLGSGAVEAMVVDKDAQIIFSDNDLLGALSRKDGNWANSVEPGGSMQREMAIRFAVNLTMYVLCSDYKNDQVHAPFLMRNRKKGP